ncbi:STAS domain-containing protein [Saccharopolyspora spinosa]|uniref:RsbT antagonist protein RsbS n=1 Tax=Saccharopolyspora spinosa TaxID=60894 RepID=A0A2N3Y5H0_SACSN|nr:STAS domain-containing protein [Saccharopolyspora spinosa]PKW18182.1 rsbT antagonist protein RsbS [Saccharopolyspora spinosa]
MASVSILELDGALVATLQGELTDGAAVGLQQDLAEAVVGVGARGVLIDISGLELVDSFLARTIYDIAAATSLLAAETVVVGMRPEVAITLVELGLTLPGLRTARTVADGMALLGIASPNRSAEGR